MIRFGGRSLRLNGTLHPYAKFFIYNCFQQGKLPHSEIGKIHIHIQHLIAHILF